MSIELKNVNYIYSKGTPFARQSLHDINLFIADGEWVTLMGPTGSGKSTLVQHLNGLLKPTDGKVLLNGEDIHGSLSTLKKSREVVGLVFQYPEHQLFGASVIEEITYGPINFGYSAEEAEELAREAMETVGLEFEKYKDRSPHELSGGEKRRVALAGVLAVKPKVIALDEPTAGLDMTGKKVLTETITRLNREKGITVIWVTHEITDIALLAERLIVLKSGGVVLDGPLRETLSNPLMQELGLDVPVAVEVANGLKRRGKQMDGLPLTIDEIHDEIIKLVR